MRIISVVAFVLLCTFFYQLPAKASQQILEDIRFERISQNEERIIFRLTGSEMPNFFTIKNGTPRLVFDFSDTGVAKRIKNNVPINGNLVDRVRVGIHENKTRVVLDLVAGRNVQTIQEPDRDHNLLTVIIHDAKIKPSSSRQTISSGSNTKAPEKTESQPVVTPTTPAPAALPTNPDKVGKWAAEQLDS